jgi:hypothetical protein
MRKLYSSGLFVLFVSPLFGQGYLQIGDIQGNPYSSANDPICNIPSEPDIRLTQSITIYSASSILEANAGQSFSEEVDRIAIFKTSNANTSASGSLKLYAKPTELDSLPAENPFDTEVLGATLIYSNDTVVLQGPINQWFEMGLDQPFSLNSDENLMLLWDWERAEDAPFAGNTAWKVESGSSAPGPQAIQWVGSVAPPTLTYSPDLIPVVRFGYDLSTSVAAPQQEDLTLYPVPTRVGGPLTLRVPENLGTASALVQDMSGKVVWQGVISGTGERTIMNGLSAGTYMLALGNEATILRARFVVAD